MRKLMVVAIVLVFAVTLAAGVQQQGKPEQKPSNKATPTVTGKWTMTLEMSMGTGTPTLELKQDGEKITGTYTGRYGTFELTGSLKDHVIAFSFTMNAEGQSATLSFEGEVSADAQSMKGTASLADMGEATWSAKRQ